MWQYPHFVKVRMSIKYKKIKNFNILKIVFFVCYCIKICIFLYFISSLDIYILRSWQHHIFLVGIALKSCGLTTLKINSLKPHNLKTCPHEKKKWKRPHYIYISHNSRILARNNDYFSGFWKVVGVYIYIERERVLNTNLNTVFWPLN